MDVGQMVKHYIYTVSEQHPHLLQSKAGRHAFKPCDSLSSHVVSDRHPHLLQLKACRSAFNCKRCGWGQTLHGNLKNDKA